ncbi:hypothetical protein [Bathymodiolus platifrons methanotrophic gill symbiont]|uniref:hypothetical protein n=1 Tax=Bathymodiolus platifrons methanotrophic gill symbiont TaxID=113268 RepID=UPI001124DEDF|nr:hypothetical protein [Bathymodiolus platifrons methanotrophic gill symbiont]
MNYFKVIPFFVLNKLFPEYKQCNAISYQPELPLRSGLITSTILIKTSLLICITWLLAGCGGFASKQEPAPVYGRTNSTDYSGSPSDKTKAEQTAELKGVQDAVILKQQELDVKYQTKKSSNVVVALLAERC